MLKPITNHSLVQEEDEEDDDDIAYAGPRRSSIKQPKSLVDGLKKASPLKRVSWISDDELRTLLPIENSKFPFYFAEISPDEEPNNTEASSGNTHSYLVSHVQLLPSLT
jgi:hypothetical protein